jgi:hypothetical protein
MTERFARFCVCAYVFAGLAGCASEHRSDSDGASGRAVVIARQTPAGDPLTPSAAPTTPAPDPQTRAGDPRPPDNDPQPGVIDPQPGGQSGGEGVETCAIVEQPLTAATLEGVRVEDLWSHLQTLLTSKIGLEWRPKVRESIPNSPTRLIVTHVELGDTLNVGCSQFKTKLEFDAHSEDDQLAGHFAGDLTGVVASDTDLNVSVALTSGQLSDGAIRDDIRDDAMITLSLVWHDWEPTVLSGTLNADAEVIAMISTGEFAEWTASPIPAAPIGPVSAGDLQRQVCVSTSAATLATFDSNDALFAAMGKRWVVCSGQTNLDPNFAGLEIDATGHWRELRAMNGELVAATGFGHEGQITRNVYGASFNLAVLDWLPERYSFFNAGLSADGQTLRLDSQTTNVVVQATFQATELPVRQPTAAFEKGARGGQAACTASEAELTTRPASIDAVRALLLGRWTFCSGRLGTDHPAIVFEAGDKFHFLESDGSTSVDGGTFVILDTSSQNGPGAFQFNLTARDQMYVFSLPIFANTPLKFMANDDFRSVLSAM